MDTSCSQRTLSGKIVGGMGAGIQTRPQGKWEESIVL